MSYDEKLLDNLFSMPKEEFSADYIDKMFEQYRIFLQMIGGLERRREMVNRFFLSINIGLLAVIGLSTQLESTVLMPYEMWKLSMPVVGITFAAIWLGNLRSYKKLSSVKWDIVQKIEERLPLKIHKVEWDILQATKYRQLTSGEQIIPICFVAVYLIIGIILYIL